MVTVGTARLLTNDSAPMLALNDASPWSCPCWMAEATVPPAFMTLLAFVVAAITAESAAASSLDLVDSAIA